MKLRKLKRLWQWKPPKVPVRVTEANGTVSINDGTRDFRILSTQRTYLYKRGVKYRMEQLAAIYGVPKFVTIRSGDVVIDIGANVGEFSLFAAGRGARVIAIEPDQFTLSCLDANLAGSPIEIIRAAAWKDDERIALNINPANANTSLINPSADRIEIDAKRLDTLLAGRSLERIRLLKGDAEGAEPELLMGAAETLRRTEYVSLDCGAERRGKHTLDDCEKLLIEAGFEIIRRQDDERCNLIARNRTL